MMKSKSSVGDETDGLTAIYHRPEPEYAYLYKDHSLFAASEERRYQTDCSHMGSFYFIGDLYEATKEMDKVTITDDPSDYFRVGICQPCTDPVPLN